VNCDVCNATVPANQGTRIAPAEFRALLAKGFGMDEMNIKMLTDAGMPREQALAMLARQYGTSQSDWLLCASCATRARELT
jgi:hypothetical protein